jgi:hypothetical protein
MPRYISTNIIDFIEMQALFSSGKHPFGQFVVIAGRKSEPQERWALFFRPDFGKSRYGFNRIVRNRSRA